MTASLDEGWALDDAPVADIDEALEEPDQGAAGSVVPEQASAPEAAERVVPEEASADAKTSQADDAPEAAGTLGRVDYEFRSKMAAAAARAPEPPSSRLAAGLAIGLAIGLCVGWFGGRSLASRATDAASNTAAPADSLAQSHDELGAGGTASPGVDAIANQAAALEAAALEAAALEAALEAAALEAAPAEAAPPEAAPPESTPPADDLASEVAIAPDAVPTDLAIETPDGAVFPISAPRDGVVTKVFAKTGQRVWKGERLFEISQPKSDIPDSSSLKEKIAELEALVGSDPRVEAELTEARRKLDLINAGYRGGRRAIAYASQGGFADHQLSIGDTVTAGQVLVRVTERTK